MKGKPVVLHAVVLYEYPAWSVCVGSPLMQHVKQNGIKLLMIPLVPVCPTLIVHF